MQRSRKRCIFNRNDLLPAGRPGGKRAGAAPPSAAREESEILVEHVEEHIPGADREDAVAAPDRDEAEQLAGGGKHQGGDDLVSHAEHDLQIRNVFRRLGDFPRIDLVLHLEFQGKDPVFRHDENVRVDADMARPLQPELEGDLPVQAGIAEHIAEIRKEARHLFPAVPEGVEQAPRIVQVPADPPAAFRQPVHPFVFRQGEELGDRAVIPGELPEPGVRSLLPDDPVPAV